MSTTDNKTNLDDIFKLEPLTIEQLDTLSAGLSATTMSSIDTIDLSGITVSTSAPSYTFSNTGTVPNTVWTSSGTGSNTFQWGATTSPMVVGNGGQVSLKGEKADIDINGKSLKNWMEKVEERLNILTPNPELEKEWDDLRKLGERYRKLEKKCKEKAEVWKKLKAMPPPKVD